MRPLTHLFWLAALIGGLAAAVLPASPARAAAAAYQGIYVVIDPYNQVNIANLQSAAQISCAKKQQVVTTPFCGAANGILLRFPWCEFELYHIQGPNGVPYPSCHYTTSFPAGGGAGIQTRFTDKVSPCSGLYDTCSGHSRSVLGTTLGYIARINSMRALGGLKPLQLSIGMFAGIGTPQTVLDSVGYVDVPQTSDPALSPASFQCFRLPLYWESQFLTDYEAAFDQALAYIKTQFPQGANIAMVKVSGVNSQDLEVAVPGFSTFYAAPLDPGPAGPGPLLNCPTSGSGLNGAQVWFNAYNQAPVAGYNFSQGVENAFGTLIGHEWATLANDGLSNTILSLATTNASEFAQIDCGVTGSSTCFVAPPSAGNYGTYYFDLYVDDLFDGGLAATAAASAYQAARSGSFTLTPAQFEVDSTDLSLTPYVSKNETPCNLNNVVPADAPVFSLDGSPLTFIGAATPISYQTAVNQGGECALGTYGTTLNNGIKNGALFLEVETDAAFTDIAACNAPLTSALNSILAVSPPTTCKY